IHGIGTDKEVAAMQTEALAPLNRPTLGLLLPSTVAMPDPDMPRDSQVRFRKGADAVVQNLLSGSGSRPSLLYQRPGYSDDARLFHDLLAYAPGMNTSLADIEAVVE